MQTHFVTGVKDGKVKTLYGGFDLTVAEATYQTARLGGEYEHAYLFQNAYPRLTCSPVYDAKIHAEEERKREAQAEAQRNAAIISAEARLKLAQAALDQAEAHAESVGIILVEDTADETVVETPLIETPEIPVAPVIAPEVTTIETPVAPAVVAAPASPEVPPVAPAVKTPKLSKAARRREALKNKAEQNK